MSYTIECNECKGNTYAENIVDLLKEHTNEDGFFVCSNCGCVDTFIYRESELQEKDEI